MVAADTETKCWSLCQPLRNDAGAWGAVAHMTSTSILFSWEAKKQMEIIVLWKKLTLVQKINLEKEKTLLVFSFHTLLCRNLRQLSLKVTSPIALLMMERISGFGLSAEINQKYHLRVTVAMWRSYDLQKCQKRVKNITVVIVRTMQCSILSFRVANSGWLGESLKAGQMVILHRIFSNIKWEAQTTMIQNTQSQESDYFQSLISLFDFEIAEHMDSSTFHYHEQLAQSLSQGKIMGKACITLCIVWRDCAEELGDLGRNWMQIKRPFKTTNGTVPWVSAIIFKYTWQLIPPKFIFVFHNEMLLSSILP